MQLYETLIKKIDESCSDVKILHLSFNVTLPPFEPGSHIDVKVHVGSRVEIRSYSVVKIIDESTLAIAVRRLVNSRGGSEYMHSLCVGNRLESTLPANHFQLSLQASEYLLIAGGIGITPIISMARLLKKCLLPFRFIYLGRSRSSMPFITEMEIEFSEELSVFADDESGKADFCKLIAPLHANGEAYMCGPVPMMEGVRKSWDLDQRKADKIRFETFGGAGVKPSESFRVFVPSRGLEIEVPANKTLLDALDEQGAEPLFSCRRGECGVCLVDIVALEGEIDHRDVFLSSRQKDDKKQLCACVSRVTGSITLELP